MIKTKVAFLERTKETRA